MELTIYDQLTGEVQWTKHTKGPHRDFGGYAWIEGKYPSHTHYIVNGVPTERPEMPGVIDKTSVAADGVDIATISGIPAGADIYNNNAEEPIAQSDGTDIELTFDLARRNKIRIALWPYLDWEETVNAS